MLRLGLLFAGWGWNTLHGHGLVQWWQIKDMAGEAHMAGRKPPWVAWSAQGEARFLLEIKINILPLGPG